MLLPYKSCFFQMVRNDGEDKLLDSKRFSKVGFGLLFPHPVFVSFLFQQSFHVLKSCNNNKDIQNIMYTDM